MSHRISHAGLLVPSIARAATVWTGVFGLEPWALGVWHVVEEGVRTLMLPVGDSAGVELLESGDPDTPFRQALDAGRGLYHMALRVADLDEAVRRLRDAESWVQVRPAGEVLRLRRGWVDPASACGAHIELVDEREILALGLPASGSPPTTGERSAPLLPGCTRFGARAGSTALVDRRGRARAPLQGRRRPPARSGRAVARMRSAVVALPATRAWPGLPGNGGRRSGPRPGGAVAARSLAPAKAQRRSPAPPRLGPRPLYTRCAASTHRDSLRRRPDPVPASAAEEAAGGGRSRHDPGRAADEPREGPIRVACHPGATRRCPLRAGSGARSSHSRRGASSPQH